MAGKGLSVSKEDIDEDHGGGGVVPKRLARKENLFRPDSRGDAGGEEGTAASNGVGVGDTGG